MVFVQSLTWRLAIYSKNPKNSDTRKTGCNHPKSRTRCLSQRVMHPKYAEGIANSVDPDQTAPQTAPLGAVCSSICPKT